MASLAELEGRYEAACRNLSPERVKAMEAYDPPQNPHEEYVHQCYCELLRAQAGLPRQVTE